MYAANNVRHARSPDLFLNMDDTVSNIRREKLTFQDPSPDFKRKLLKAGGVSCIGTCLSVLANRLNASEGMCLVRNARVSDGSYLLAL